jgi:hypothetical protein
MSSAHFGKDVESIYEFEGVHGAHSVTSGDSEHENLQLTVGS